MKHLSIRQWLSFIVAGLVGQLAWAIENNYLNLYVFYSTDSTQFIPIMTAASAAAATITTLFIGALSDRLGKRKSFISFGYILWGISIILFSFISPKTPLSITSGAFVGANSALISGTLIVIMDCVMTFFGSSANDAAFNAYVTDKTSSNNRGKVESVLSILPLLSMIAVVLIGGIFTSGSNPRWDMFFYIFGGLTIVCGVLSIFLFPKDDIKPSKEENYFKNIFYGFRPKVIKTNKLLYVVLISFMVFNMAIQVFMPYFMVYIQENLLIKDGDFTIVLGIVLIVACILTVIVGLFMDKMGKNKVIFPAIAGGVVGALVLFFAGNNKVLVIIGGIIIMTGYLVGTAVLGAKVRDYTPTDGVGLFQGIRMLFVVLLPMVTGPFIGQALTYIQKQEYVNEYGVTTVLPNKYIFLGAALVLLIAIVPVLLTLKMERSSRNVK